MLWFGCDFVMNYPCIYELFSHKIFKKEKTMLQVRIIWLNFHHEKLSNRNTIRYNIWKKGHINQTKLIFKSIEGISGGEEKTCKE